MINHYVGGVSRRKSSGSNSIHVRLTVVRIAPSRGRYGRKITNDDGTTRNILQEDGKHGQVNCLVGRLRLGY